MRTLFMPDGVWTIDAHGYWYAPDDNDLYNEVDMIRQDCYGSIHIYWRGRAGEHHYAIGRYE